MFKDGSRIIFRLSGTGSVGATVRLYVEQYEARPDHLGKMPQDALGPLIELALEVSKLKAFIKRENPDVIT